MDNLWFQIIFGSATVYFGFYIFLIFPTLLRLLAALLFGKVKWPGPRIHDPDPGASKVRERLGVGYENLFSAFLRNASSVLGAFVFSILTFLSSTPFLNEYILIKSPWLYLILSLVALVGGNMAVVKGMHNKAQVDVLLSDLANKAEPRAVDGQSAEAEYAIEHPLIEKRSRSPDIARALNLFYESVRCHQDGNEWKALTFYQEALDVNPALHADARDALTKMANNSSPEDEGPIDYWLGIHSEYLLDYRQAAIWYEKAVGSFHKNGYQKRESRARCNLGNVKMQSGDPTGIEEFEKAIALNPKNGTAHMNIGFTYYMISEPGDERYEMALDALAHAILADPEIYGPMVQARLRSVGYTWKEDIQRIAERIAKMQGIG